MTDATPDAGVTPGKAAARIGQNGSLTLATQSLATIAKSAVAVTVFETLARLHRVSMSKGTPWWSGVSAGIRANPHDPTDASSPSFITQYAYPPGP